MNKLWKKLKEIYSDFEYVELDYDMDDIDEYNVGEILPVLIIYKNNIEVKRIIGEKSEKEFFKEIEEII
ncbi:MAG: hypothetical protein J6G98_04515 [Bacilli bacterium]|nr:hypothetical protein [Bacilli bacterium]